MVSDTATTSLSDRRAALAGIGLMTAGIFLFAVNDALGKWLVATYSVGQVLLIRSLAALSLLAPFIWRDRASFAQAPRWGMQALRAVSRHRRGRLLLLGGGLSAARRRDGLLPRRADLRHRDRRRVAAASRSAGGAGARCSVGFLGVIVCLRPGSAALSWPALIALAGSFTFSLSMISTRTLRGTSDTVLVTSQTVAALVFGAALAPFAWVTPSPRDLRAAGAARHGRDGGACLRQPLAEACAGQHRGAVSVHHDRLGGAVRLCGVRRRAGRCMLAGAAIIIGAGLFIFLRERRLARRASFSEPPP